jgi:hypothetical protein
MFVSLEIVILLLVSVPFILAREVPNFTAVLGATFVAYIFTVVAFIKEKDEAIQMKLREEFNLEDY